MAGIVEKLQKMWGTRPTTSMMNTTRTRPRSPRQTAGRRGAAFRTPFVLLFRAPKTQRVVNINHARAGAQVVVFKPNSFRDDTNSIADEINQGHTVVVNFEETNASEARYILAFLSGASYANHGEVRPIAAKTYIFTPAGVSLSGAEIRDDLAQNGVTF